MIKLKPLIIESLRSTPISAEYMYSNLMSLSTIKDDAVNCIINKPIYRGLNGGEDIMMVDPSKYERVSLDGYNFYTLIIDNMDTWKDYPKRSRSIICASKTAAASSYGALYRVIPLNPQAKFGVCSKGDIWISFNKQNFNSLSGVNGDFAYIANFIIQKTDIASSNHAELDLLKKIHKSNQRNTEHISYDELKWFLNFIDINKIELSNYNVQSTLISKFIREYFDVAGEESLLKLTEKALEPEDNGFSLVNYYDDAGWDHVNSHEVWTDSKCILIKLDYFTRNVDDILHNIRSL